MPPSYKEKTTKKKDWGSENLDLVAKFRKLRVKLTTKIKQQLGDLTYGECDAFATEVATVDDMQEAIDLLGEYWKRCTMQTRVSKAHITQEGEITWAERCRTEAVLNS
jgi:hypothetical protein